MNKPLSIKTLAHHMKKFASILFLFSTLNLYGQTPAPLAIKPSKKYTLQIDAGVNYFRYSYYGGGGNREITTSHYEAISIERELNPTFSVSLGLRNTNYGYKRHINEFDGTNGKWNTNIVQQWNYWTIQTPVQIKVKPFQSKKLSLNAGGYLGFNYYNSESTSSTIYTIPHDNEKNLLDIGMNVGIDYNWFKKGDFTLGNSVSYYRGFAYVSHYTLERSQGLTIGCTAKWGL